MGVMEGVRDSGALMVNGVVRVSQKNLLKTSEAVISVVLYSALDSDCIEIHYLKVRVST